MPNRIIREGILTSPRMAKLGWADEVFYRRLMSLVDDFGRYYADFGLLRAHLYPRQLSKVSDSDIEKWLRACVDAALVRVYPAEDGERYLEVLDFRQQVRAKESKFPGMSSECVADDTQLQSISKSSAPVFVDVSVSVDECVSARKRATHKPVKTGIPEGFCVSDRVKAWAKEKGFDRLDEHMQAFVRKCSANAYRYADWDAAFQEAVREDWAKLRGRAINGSAPPADSATKVEVWKPPPPLTAEEMEASKRAKAMALGAIRRVG